MKNPIFDKSVFTEHIECNDKPKGMLRIVKKEKGNPFEVRCDSCMKGMSMMGAESVSKHYKEKLDEFWFELNKNL